MFNKLHAFSRLENGGERNTQLRYQRGRQFISREDYQRLEGSRDAQQYIIASLLSMIARGTFGYCQIRFTRVLLHNIVPHPGPT